MVWNDGMVQGNEMAQRRERHSPVGTEREDKTDSWINCCWPALEVNELEKSLAERTF